MAEALEARRKAAEEARMKKHAAMEQAKAEAAEARERAQWAHQEATRIAKAQARERRIAARKLEKAKQEAKRLEWEAALRANKARTDKFRIKKK